MDEINEEKKESFLLLQNNRINESNSTDAPKFDYKFKNQDSQNGNFLKKDNDKSTKEHNNMMKKLEKKLNVKKYL